MSTDRRVEKIITCLCAHASHLQAKLMFMFSLPYTSGPTAPQYGTVS